MLSEHFQKEIGSGYEAFAVIRAELCIIFTGSGRKTIVTTYSARHFPSDLS